MIKKRQSTAPRINKEFFKMLFTLHSEQPWLVPKETELLSLLEECQNENQQRLICDLLSRFVYQDSARRGEILDQMVVHFRDCWELDASTTQVVAMTYDDDADSGQATLWNLKSYFSKHNWNPAARVNKIGKAIAKFRDLPTIVLVDEFAGTGKTVQSRIDYLCKNIAQHCSVSPYDVLSHIYVALIASMERARKHVDDLGVDVYVGESLRRGITDHLKGKILQKACKNMLNIESLLADEVDGEKLPTFGYGRAEALFAFETGNTPNSVFPVFWWKQLRNRDLRNPLLNRS